MMEQFENVVDIKLFLPHREPMLMVDYILELTPTEVKTIFEIKEDNLFVADGFFSETGLVENGAQTCSSIVGQFFFLDENQQVKEDVEVIGFISGIKKITVHELPEVGSTITTNSVLLSRFDTDEYSIGTMTCQTFCEEVLLFEAEINLFIQEKR